MSDSPTQSAASRVQKELYECLCYWGTLPEPEGDVPERYHRWNDLGEIAERLLAAMTDSPIPSADGWQSMGTAPKNGAAVLVYDHPHVEMAHYSVQSWVITNHGMAISPTHWMPLPAPPISSVNKG